MTAVAAPANPMVATASIQPVRVKPGTFRQVLSNPNAPLWVVDKTGVNDHTLWHWRRRGWLTPPGPDHWDQARPGTGRRFDWEAALDQIDWLARIMASQDGPSRTRAGLDKEDAAAGWRLRDLGAPYAYRILEGGTWLPLYTLEAWIPLPDRPHMLAVVKP